MDAQQHDVAFLLQAAEEQAALRRVATAVASEADQEWLFAVVTEGVGRLLGANSANTLRYEPDGTGVVVGAWSTSGVRAVPVGTREALDGPTAGTQILHSGRPARVESFADMEGSTAEMLRGLGFRSAVGAPITLSGRLWGAVLISSVEEEAFPAGSEQRVADFAELVALALANAHAREEVAASRARIVEAGDAERRRIERNLHDGAQQRLVTLSLFLRLAERQLPDGASRARRSWREQTASWPRRSTSSETSPAVSIRRSSLIAGSVRRSRCSRCAPASRRDVDTTRRPPT